MHTTFHRAKTVTAAAAMLLLSASLHAAAPAVGADGSGANGTGANAAESAAVAVSLMKPAVQRAGLFERTASAFSFHMPTEMAAARAQAFGMAPYFSFSHAETIGGLPTLGTIGSSSPVSGMLGLAHQFALIGPVRRFAETDRWNTSDSSRPNDFAICYRFSRMLGLQIVPGDLTPSKLPTPRMLSTKTYGNGMGVLAGITFRIGRR